MDFSREDTLVINYCCDFILRVVFNCVSLWSTTTSWKIYDETFIETIWLYNDNNRL